MIGLHHGKNGRRTRHQTNHVVRRKLNEELRVTMSGINNPTKKPPTLFGKELKFSANERPSMPVAMNPARRAETAQFQG